MIKYKYQILAVLIILLVVSGPLLVFYDRTKTLIIYDAGDSAKDIASSIATFLEQDIEPYAALNKVQNYETEPFDRQYYQKMLLTFQALKLKTGASFIFTEKFLSKESISYILDAEPTESEQFSPIGTVDGVSEKEWEAFQKGRSTATDLIRDPVWGNYITGFAPIRDSANNQVIGLVGVDFSADYILNVLKGLKSALILLFVVISSAVSLLVILFMNKHLKRSNEDFLTGLGNRRAFEETLAGMVRSYQSKKISFSLLMIDVDKFKQINDTYGHGVGDLVLKRVANLIRTSIKESDFLFRYGGDEFVVLLPNTTKDQANFIAKRLQDEFSGTSFHIDETQHFKILVSVGVAEYEPNMSAKQFLQEADEAMYQKKNNSKKILCM